MSRDAVRRSVFWSRADRPGSESFTLRSNDGGWSLVGTVLVWLEGRPVRIEYAIDCGPDWLTRTVEVDLERDGEINTLRLDAQAGVWRSDAGGEIEAVRGAIDADVSFSPSTNTLPIRRLDLPVGASADVVAAWVRVPGLELERLEQRYTRIGERRYRYESRGGSFVREIDVDEEGLVEDYPGIWRRERS